MIKRDIVLVLHDIRSIHNVGSLFRTSDAAGVSRIILSGYTPAPVDRFGRIRKDLAKVSLGAEKTIPWSHIEHIEPALEELKKDGYTVALLEQDPRSTSLFAWRSESAKIALVLGNEVEGIDQSILDIADVILEIPMYGSKESLNVSVAGGIALYALTHTNTPETM